MWKNGLVLLAHFLLLLSFGEVSYGKSNLDYSRDDFPSSFVFGAGTSAFQVEGAVAEDGRAPSIWDSFTHAGKMADKSNADVTSNGYHKYKEDVKLMVDTGLEAYRFSISWPRLLPNGRGAVNPKGLEYYNNLINELVKHGIKPHVTLFHMDLPQVIQDEYGGWLSPRIIDDFREYADVCFREFGDRVTQWTTTVEPNVISQAAYDSGFFPPERCSYPFGRNCSAGNSTVEPYIATHITLLAHAAVFNLYKTKYKAEQNGQVGINVYSFWCYPFSNSSADTEATQRVRDFMIGWILDPLIFGDYPEVMRKIVGQRLPSFTESQAAQVKGAFDFIGLNHYTSVYVKDNSKGRSTTLRDYNADMFATLAVSLNDTSAFTPTRITIDPPGISKMLGYLKEAYGNPPIYIEENGYGLARKAVTVNDTERVEYLRAYIGSTLDAIRNGSNVQGYFVWSFLDVFELLLGYQSSYGLYYVDFEDGSLKRQPKLSAHWYSKFLKTRNEVISVRDDGLQEMSRNSQ